MPESNAPMVTTADLREANADPEAAGSLVNSDEQLDDLQEAAVAALRTVYDPEIPVNIYDLGLIYNIVIHRETLSADVTMTLTAPGCPVAEEFPEIVSNAVKTVDGIDEVSVEITFDPPWTKDMMSEAAQLQLGML